MGPGAAVAVLVGKATGTANLLEGMPLQEQSVSLGQAVGLGDQHQDPLPEVFLLVVGCQPGTQVAGLPDIHQAVNVMADWVQQLKQQLEQDVQSVTLDWMAEEALADLAAGSYSG